MPLLVESQSRNPAMFRPDPISLRDVAGTATGVLGALGGAALGLEPTLEGGFTAIEGGFREGKLKLVKNYSTIRCWSCWCTVKT